jgi:parallel beta-helix repeat protein
LLENTEGIRCDWYATPKIQNNVIFKNGTGILVIHASFPAIENNTIHGNKRFGIRIPDWQPEIKPTVVRDNGYPAPDAILIEQNILSENKEAAIHCDKNVPCKVARNNLYQNNIFINALTNMEGNVSMEPLFVDALNDDFRLSPESPCLRESIGAHEG